MSIFSNWVKCILWFEFHSNSTYFRLCFLDCCGYSSIVKDTQNVLIRNHLDLDASSKTKTITDTSIRVDKNAGLFTEHFSGQKFEAAVSNTDNPISEAKPNDTVALSIPSSSPKIHRVKPNSIRKQRTIQDEYFHERKPLMSRTNYMDDSNINLSSYSATTSHVLKEPRISSANELNFPLTRVKKRKREQKESKDRSNKYQNINVCDVTNFYMASTSQNRKIRKRYEKDKQKKPGHDIDSNMDCSIDNGNITLFTTNELFLSINLYI